jgi:hypothetical protein
MSMDDIVAGKEKEVDRREVVRSPADPPAMIECWTAWVDGRQKVLTAIKDILAALAAAEGEGVA